MTSSAISLARVLCSLSATFITSTVTAAPCNAPSPIKFAPGSAKSTVPGAIARGEEACWTIQAKYHQSLKLTIESPEQNAVFQIYRPGWEVKNALDGASDVKGIAMRGAGPTDDARHWSGVLPVSGRFLIVVATDRGGAPYDLNIAIR